MMQKSIRNKRTLRIGSVWISEDCVEEYSYGLIWIIDMIDLEKEFLFSFRDVDDVCLTTYNVTKYEDLNFKSSNHTD